jgi:hypothetical protein
MGCSLSHKDPKYNNRGEHDEKQRKNPETNRQKKQ